MDELVYRWYSATVRSYGQYCSLARALDLIGDRWSLLIVRELAIRPCRYSDLRDGLPSMATNLLADRLRTLAAAGVVTRTDAPPPVATALYELSPWGRQLVPIATELSRWADRLMHEPPDEGEIFRGRWLVMAVPSLLGETVADHDLTVRVRFELDEPVDVVIADGRIRVELHASTEPDAVVSAEPYATMGLIAGAVTPDDANIAPFVRGSAEHLSRFASIAQQAATSRSHTD